MQFQADLLGVTVTRPKVIETTALGAAFLAGLAVGVWQDVSELEQLKGFDRAYEPGMDEVKREAVVAGWKRAVGYQLGSSDN